MHQHIWRFQQTLFNLQEIHYIHIFQTQQFISMYISIISQNIKPHCLFSLPSNIKYIIKPLKTPEAQSESLIELMITKQTNNVCESTVHCFQQTTTLEVTTFIRSEVEPPKLHSK